MTSFVVASSPQGNMAASGGTVRATAHEQGNRFPLRGSSPNPAPTLPSLVVVPQEMIPADGRCPAAIASQVPAPIRHRSADTLTQGAAAISRLS